MIILAIESSCDETAAAVVKNGTVILSSVVASSTAMHRKYGGIVPEIAAREQLHCILPTIQEALAAAKVLLEDIDAYAVAFGPGLIGSLLVGVETVKTLALTTNKPVIPVNHVIAHMFANALHTAGQKKVEFPAVSLVVSGGHTELFLLKSWKNVRWLGGTLDDAAGEAFDKSARLLGFENQGGPAIQNAARLHVPSQKYTVTLPRPMVDSNTPHFSFSGLKTAIYREWHKMQATPEAQAAFAYEIQEAITDVLTQKTLLAAQKHEAKSVLLSGGVAANLRLREKIQHLLTRILPSATLHIPPVHLCTDNAAYIAAYATLRGEPTAWKNVRAVPNLSVETDI